MCDTDDYVLPNGYTFLAITAGYRGSWAKAHDPITAARNAHFENGGDKNAVMVIYGKNDELSVSGYGGYNWERDNPPTPIGIFTVKHDNSFDDETEWPSIEPVKKGEFNDEHADCFGWMCDEISELKYWEKKDVS